MKKFHITVTNTETNEVIHDIDTDAIVGGIASEGGAFAVGLTSCDALTLFTTVQSAKTAIEHCTEDSPLLSLLSTLFDNKKSKGLKADEPNDDTDN